MNAALFNFQYQIEVTNDKKNMVFLVRYKWSIYPKIHANNTNLCMCRGVKNAQSLSLGLLKFRLTKENTK